LIDEIVRDGARRMLAEALRAEVDAYIAQFTGDRDEYGRRLVVCKGSYHSIGRLSSSVVAISKTSSEEFLFLGGIAGEFGGKEPVAGPARPPGSQPCTAAALARPSVQRVMLTLELARCVPPGLLGDSELPASDW
jgi:hypothetical protein